MHRKWNNNPEGTVFAIFASYYWENVEDDFLRKRNLSLLKCYFDLTYVKSEIPSVALVTQWSLSFYEFCYRDKIKALDLEIASQKIHEWPAKRC